MISDNWYWGREGRNLALNPLMCGLSYVCIFSYLTSTEHHWVVCPKKKVRYHPYCVLIISFLTFSPVSAKQCYKDYFAVSEGGGKSRLRFRLNLGKMEYL